MGVCSFSSFEVSPALNRWSPAFNPYGKNGAEIKKWFYL